MSDDQVKPTTEEQGPVKAEPSESNGRVLIVDDDEATLQMFSFLMKKKGYDVRAVECGRRALEEWKKEPADLLLTDMMLPDIHGREIAARVLEMTPDAAVIMVTGQPSAENTAGELAGKIFGFLVKPVSINVLTICVTRAFERLALIRRNTELLGRLREQVAELEETRHVKKRYLSFIVHELKRPLQAVFSASEALGLMSIQDPDVSMMVGMIDRNVKAMVEMVNNILTLEKTKFMTEIENFAEVEVRPLVEEVSHDFTTVMSNKGVDFISLIPADLGVTADREKLKAIFSNLIGNAVKFTLSGRITVSGKKDREEIHFSVADTGRGMEDREQEIVLRTLKDIAPVGCSLEGSGFGLAFVRDFISLHGGNVWFTSDPGIGTTFHFTLPLKYFVIEQTKDVAELHFVGTRLLSQGRELKRQISDLMAARVKTVIMDLEKVSYVDSMEISLLFTLYRTISDNNGSLKLKHVSWQVLEILKLTQLDHIIEILPKDSKSLNSPLEDSQED